MKKKMCISLLFLMLLFSVSGCSAEEEIQETMQENEEQDIAAQEEESAEDTYEQDTDADVDEETKKELTLQLLQENDLDTSVAANTKVTKGCSFTLPEDFTESKDIPGLYVTKYYPVDISTIYYAQLEEDMALQLMTKEDFADHLKNSLRELYDTEVEVVIESFEIIRIDGYPAFRSLFGYTIEGIRLTQLAYIINADQSYVITYSQTDEYDRMEEYEESAATIQVE